MSECIRQCGDDRCEAQRPTQNRHAADAINHTHTHTHRPSEHAQHTSVHHHHSQFNTSDGSVPLGYQGADWCVSSSSGWRVSAGAPRPRLPAAPLILTLLVITVQHKCNGHTNSPLTSVTFFAPMPSLGCVTQHSAACHCRWQFSG